MRGRTAPTVALIALAVGAALTFGCGREPDVTQSLRRQEPAFLAAADIASTLGGAEDFACTAPSAALRLDGIGQLLEVCNLPQQGGTRFIEFRHPTGSKTTGSHGFRGVILAPDDQPPQPQGTCIRHLFDRWWQYVRANDRLACPPHFEPIGAG